MDTQAQQPNMLKAALWYAKRGWYVFPVHVPLFDADGACVGCTCESWKRTTSKYGPNYKCPQPGKCPAVKWSGASTTDPDQLRKWFGHEWKTPNAETGAILYYTPNIGIDCGKSDLLVLDRDTYKDGYADMLTVGQDQRQTVTNLTGSGGEQLIYAMQGKGYSNATGELPYGNDIRGVGGYIVAPPSLHKSGRRYQFEEGYDPTEIELKSVPPALQSILDNAQCATTAKLATFNLTDVAKPDLKRWKLSEKIIGLIVNSSPKGQRSHADQSAILALVAQGATDDEIRGVFIHYAIGEKYNEQGDHYLALSISKARTHFAKHGCTAEVIDTVTGEIIKLSDLMEFCRKEIARRDLPESQEQVALAGIQRFEHVQGIEATMSDRHLSGLAAVEKRTANNAMKGRPIIQKTKDADGNVIKRVRVGRKSDGLDQWLFTKAAKGNGITADVYRLSDVMMQAYREEIPTIEHNGAVPYDTNITMCSLWGFSRGVLALVEDNMVDDAFIRNVVPAKFRRKAANYVMPEGDRIARLDALMNSPAEDGRKRLKSFTQIGPRLIAHLEKKNGQSLSELAQALGKHPATVAAAVARLARRQLQETVLRPLVRVVQMGSSKRVFLYSRWQERLSALRPLMYTDGLLKSRQIHYAEQRIGRINKILGTCHPTDEQRKVYKDIADRTKRMIDAIEGTPTAKAAARLLHNYEDVAQPVALELTINTVPATVESPTIELPTVSRSVRNPAEWQRSIMGARKSQDPSQRWHAGPLEAFLAGKDVEKRILVSAIYAINQSLTFDPMVAAVNF